MQQIKFYRVTSLPTAESNQTCEVGSLYFVHDDVNNFNDLYVCTGEYQFESYSGHLYWSDGSDGGFGEGGSWGDDDTGESIDPSLYLPLTGGTMSGDITMSGENKLIFGGISVYNNGSLFINDALQVDGLVTANGFTHAVNNSDDYVLLAGGGTKLLSEISPDVSGYLPLTGGTMTGDTKFNGASIYFDEDCAALKINDAGALEIYSEDGITLSGFVECDGSINCASSIQAQAFYETSDARKKDIKSDLSLDKCYDLIDKCQTVIYSIKDQTKEQVGMIAQEIEEFFPEVVATDEEGFKSLAYDRLVVICFKVLKDIIKRLEKLENV